MRIAVLADVHANAAALDAVLRDVAAVASDRVVCLGDIVGYGPDVTRCIAHVRGVADVVVAGNHDVAVAAGIVGAGTNPHALASHDYTRRLLSAEERSWLAVLPSLHVDPDGFVAAHGSYLSTNHTTGYITSTMLDANLDVIERENAWPKVALFGHTHVPYIGWRGPDGTLEPAATDRVAWAPAARATLINPGSVGQPRDCDPRACWALVDLAERHVTFRRVEYDIERTIHALERAGMPRELGERLREGR